MRLAHSYRFSGKSGIIDWAGFNVPLNTL